MKLAVVGCGAIGGVVGAMLHKAGADVVFFDSDAPPALKEAVCTVKVADIAFDSDYEYSRVARALRSLSLTSFSR